jgi:hypothetical protein
LEADLAGVGGHAVAGARKEGVVGARLQQGSIGRSAGWKQQAAVARAAASEQQQQQQQGSDSRAAAAAGE